MSNAINPEHYNRLNPQPKDVIRAWGLNFNLGSAVKYISRAGHKDDIVQDLKKAQEFIQFEIDAIEGARAESVKDLVAYQKKVLRHEIVHAFLYESGLWQNAYGSKCWAKNEEMIDWMAIQIPKIQRAYKEAYCDE